MFPLDQIVSARTVEDPQVSPDSRSAVFVVGEVSKDGEHALGDLWLWRDGGGTPTRLTAGDHRDDNPCWSPDSRYVAFASDRAKAGTKQLYILPVDGGEAVKLTNHDGGISEPLWSPDGSIIAYLVNEPETDDEKRRKEERDDAKVIDANVKRTHIWVIDLPNGPDAARQGNVGTPRQVNPEHIHVGSMMQGLYTWFPDSSRFVAVVAEGPKADYLWYPDLVTISLDGDVRTLGTYAGLFIPPQVSPDSQTIAFIASSSTAPMAIGVPHIINANGGNARALPVGDKGSASNVAWLPDGKRLLVSLVRGLRSDLEMVPIDGSDCQLAFPDQDDKPSSVLGGPTVSNNGQRVAFIRSDINHGVDLWIGDIGKSAVRVSDVNPWIADYPTGDAIEIEWASTDGQTVQGLVLLPVGYQEGKSYPLLVHIHGGPMGAWTTRLYASWHDWGQIMAQRGYAVLLPNPRGSSGRGASYLAANVNDLGGLEWADIDTGVDEVIRRGIADPNRLVIGGWSYGGFFTNWAITHTDRFKAAVSGAGLSNWVSFEGTTDIRRIFDAYFPTETSDDASGQWESSPLRWIRNASTPTLILHGEADERVPVSQSYELYEGLKSRGLKTQFVVYPREPHSILERHHQRDLLHRTIRWYDDHLSVRRDGDETQANNRYGSGEHKMAVETSKAVDITQYDDLDGVVNALMETWTIPGIAVGIYRDGEIETHGFGVTSMETNQPVTPDTLFQIGSISKVFCATLVMVLVEKGQLDLDTPISQYLPELKLQDESAHQMITLRHTLSHTSGLYGDFFDDFGFGDDALTKAIAQFDTLRQVTAPGELWTYCNSGFNLAAAVIEQVLETTYESAMAEHVFKPLGLDRSFFFAHEAIAYPVAVGHTQVEPDSDEMEVVRQYPLPRAVNGAGGIISTVKDLLKFAAFHISGGTIDGEQVMQPDTIKSMQEVQTEAANFAESWGIGWDIRSINGEVVIGHGGTTNGFQARLSIVPDKRYAVAILTNGNRGWAVNAKTEEWALKHDCGLDVTRHTPVELEPGQINRLCGKYQNPISNIALSSEDGSIRIDMTVKSPLTDDEKVLPPVWAKPVGDLELIVTSGSSEGIRADFIPGPDGSIRFIRFGGRLADRVE